MTELQNKYKQYETEAPSKSDEENQKRSIELQEAQKNIQGAQQKASQELQNKQIALLGPISGSGVIVAKGTDILPLVKKELGF